MSKSSSSRLLAIDTARWSGQRRGPAPQRERLGEDFVVIQDYENGRTAELTTCRVLGRLDMAGLGETVHVVAAAESYASHYILRPRISRIDLARDLWIPGLRVDQLEGHFDRGEFNVESYRPPRGCGITVQGVSAFDRLRIYDRGLKISNSTCRSSVWRVEVQLNRLHIPVNRRTIDSFRIDMPASVTKEIDEFLLRHGALELVA